MRFMFHLHLNLQKAFFFRLKHLHDNWHQKMGCRRCYQESTVMKSNLPIWVVEYGNSKHLNSKSSKWEDHIQDNIKWYGFIFQLLNDSLKTRPIWLHPISKSAGKRRLEVVLIEEIQRSPPGNAVDRLIDHWRIETPSALTHLGTIYLSSFSSLLVNDFIFRKSKIEGWHPAHIIASLLAAKKQRFRMQISF